VGTPVAATTVDELGLSTIVVVSVTVDFVLVPEVDKLLIAVVDVSLVLLKATQFSPSLLRTLTTEIL